MTAVQTFASIPRLYAALHDAVEAYVVVMDGKMVQMECFPVSALIHVEVSRLVLWNDLAMFDLVDGRRCDTKPIYRLTGPAYSMPLWKPYAVEHPTDKFGGEWLWLKPDDKSELYSFDPQYRISPLSRLSKNAEIRYLLHDNAPGLEKVC